MFVISVICVKQRPVYVIINGSCFVLVTCLMCFVGSVLCSVYRAGVFGFGVAIIVICMASTFGFILLV